MQFNKILLTLAVVSSAFGQLSQPALEISNRIVHAPGVPDGTLSTRESTVRLRGLAKGVAGIERVTWESDRGIGGQATLRTRFNSKETEWQTEPISLRPGRNRIKLQAIDSSNQAATSFIAVDYAPDAITPSSQLARRTSSFRGKSVNYEVSEGRALYQGDILLGPVDDAGMLADSSQSPRSSRLAPRASTIALGSDLWPSVAGVAHVPYSGAATTAATTAIATFNSTFSGIIQWIPRTSETNYVAFSLNSADHSGGCVSNVGMTGGQQTITGSIDCVASTLMHEMGHAVGLWHEQSRMDRDGYVTVVSANIDKPNATNFDKELSNEVDLGLYDFASIMHYAATLFGKFGIAPTLESIPAGIPLSNNIGYTAGDMDAVKRLYGHVPTSVTIDSNPSGAQVVVDGVTVTTPQTFNWSLNSSHTLDVPADPQTIGGQLCIFGRWNNLGGTSRTNQVTISAGSGTSYSPTTAPAVTVYSANFIPIYEYGLSAGTHNGTGTVSPLPSLHFGGKDYFTNRQLISLTATPNGGFGFHEWFNISLFNLFANPNNLYVGNSLTNTLPDFMAAPVLTVATNAPLFPAIGTFPSIAVKVDGNNTSTPQNFTWASARTLDGTPVNPSPVTTNISYAFSNWSDGGSQVHAVTPVGGANQTITANYTPTYRTLVSRNPFCGGSITPGSDLNTISGNQVNYTATPAAGLTFVGWSGDFSGNSNPFPATVNDQIVATANFNVTGTSAPLSITGVSPSSVAASPNAQTLTLSGTGFLSGKTNAFWNNSFRPLTNITSTSATMQLNAGDRATAGYSDIQVNNSSGGCAAFVDFTYPVTTSGQGPALSIAKVHSGNFAQGQNAATYTVTVSNAVGAGSTTGTVTVTENVPAGLTLVSMAGNNWTCPAGGNTCTQSNSLAGGSSYSPITVNVNVSPTATSSVTNQVSVSGGGSAVANASDLTTIVQTATQLKFTASPASGTVGSALTPVVVQVQDAAGNPVTTSNASITVTSTPAGPSANLQASNGSATFNGLVVNAAGNYTLTATAPGLTSATTTQFTVSSGNASAPPSVTIEAPTPGLVVSSGTVLVSGWALDNTTAIGSAIASVQVKVDGNLIGTARYGDSRPDVCGAFPARPGCPNVGYAYSVSTALLAPGPHTITVLATDTDGTPNTTSASVNITVAALAMPSTRVGVARSGSQFLQDVNGNGTVDGPDRFLTTFAPPGGLLPGDLPVVGDWNGDGHTKAGFYRPSTGKWWLDANNNGTFDTGDLAYSFGGLAGDLPFAGDWNAIPGVSVNKSCIGIYRSNGSVWLLDLNCNGTFDNTPTDAFFPFGGLAGDVPVVGNWTGTQTRVGVVRKYAPLGIPQGEPFFWVLDAGSAIAGNAPANHPAAAGAFPFGGLAGDQFVTGDWLGTGTARAGVYRNGLWVLDANGLHNPDLVLTYGGVASDIAMPGKW